MLMCLSASYSRKSSAGPRLLMLYKNPFMSLYIQISKPSLSMKTLREETHSQCTLVSQKNQLVLPYYCIGSYLRQQHKPSQTPLTTACFYPAQSE